MILMQFVDPAWIIFTRVAILFIIKHHGELRYSVMIPQIVYLGWVEYVERMFGPLIFCLGQTKPERALHRITNPELLYKSVQTKANKYDEIDEGSRIAVAPSRVSCKLCFPARH